MDQISKISNYYISYNKLKEEALHKTNLKLKYDYCRLDTLEKIQDFSLITIPSRYRKSEEEVESTFVDYLGQVIDEMDTEKVLYFFENVLEISNLRYLNIDMDECRSRIISENGEIRYDIILPKREKNTDLLSAATAHELAHFSLFLGKNNIDICEYSEALSIFFEYMMYKAIDKKRGKDKFISNRMCLIGENIRDLEIDIMYATNPNYLGIDSKNYTYALASNLTYIESFEYVLELINRRRENRKLVDEHIGKMLIGEETLEKVAKKMDINVDSYKNIYKLTK